jgi:hypothetical protein
VAAMTATTIGTDLYVRLVVHEEDAKGGDDE